LLAVAWMNPTAEADLLVVAQTAPAVRVSIGEEFGLPPGAIATGAGLFCWRRHCVVGRCRHEVPLCLSVHGRHLHPGQLVTALKRLGFAYVFDVLTAADLTIMEEAHELLDRLERNMRGDPDAPAMPMFTSCCPGWISERSLCTWVCPKQARRHRKLCWRTLPRKEIPCTVAMHK
jgi:iron only hydrogenase large subunit-like protein